MYIWFGLLPPKKQCPQPCTAQLWAQRINARRWDGALVWGARPAYHVLVEVSALPGRDFNSARGCCYTSWLFSFHLLLLAGLRWGVGIAGFGSYLVKLGNADDGLVMFW